MDEITRWNCTDSLTFCTVQVSSVPYFRLMDRIVRGKGKIVFNGVDFEPILLFSISTQVGPKSGTYKLVFRESVSEPTRRVVLIKECTFKDGGKK